MPTEGKSEIRTIRNWLENNLIPWNGKDTQDFTEWLVRFEEAKRSLKFEMNSYQIVKYMIKLMKDNKNKLWMVKLGEEAELDFERKVKSSNTPSLSQEVWEGETVMGTRDTKLVDEFLEYILAKLRLLVEQMDNLRNLGLHAGITSEGKSEVPKNTKSGDVGKKPPGKPVPIMKDTKDVKDITCNCCGRKGHKARDCKLNEAKHPDRNPDSQVDFFASEKGKLWDEWYTRVEPTIPKPQRVVKFHQTLSGEKFESEVLATKPGAGTKRKGDDSTINHKVYKKHGKCMNEHMSSELCVPCTTPVTEYCDGIFEPCRLVEVDDATITSSIVIETPTGKRHRHDISIMLDTGMNPAYAYINYRVAEWSKHHGIKSRKVSKRVCSCLSDCKNNSISIDEELDIPFRIYNIYTNKYEVFIITCSVINTLTHDCIFGFQLIKQNKSLRHIMFHSLLQEEDLDDLQKIIQTYHQQKKLLDTKQYTFQEQLECINNRLNELEMHAKLNNEQRAKQEELVSAEKQAVRGEDDKLLTTNGRTEEKKNNKPLAVVKSKSWMFSSPGRRHRDCE